MFDEKNIWDTFRYGDESSFKLIFEQFYTPLFNYGHKFTADDHIIEDALQDLFVKLWKNKDNIRETSSVRNYLYKAFRRVLLRKLSYAPQVVGFSSPDDKLDFNFQLGHDHTLISEERLQEIRQNLSDALKKMTPRQREIIHLRYYEEMEYEEIADIMQLSVSSTYKLLYRAIETLRNNLSNTDFLLLLSLLSLKKV